MLSHIQTTSLHNYKLPTQPALNTGLTPNHIKVIWVPQRESSKVVANIIVTSPKKLLNLC